MDVLHYNLNKSENKEWRRLYPEMEDAGGEDTVSLFCRQTKKLGKEICILELSVDYTFAFGMGERFNRVDQKNLTVESRVFEKFCEQGKDSYCPIPFFFTDSGVGIYVETMVPAKFFFGESIQIEIERDSQNRWPTVHLFEGSPKEILQKFTELTGKPREIPKWSLGPWMSANRWNTQAEIERQATMVKKSGLPHTVLVVEAWSDEATFYRFNEHDEWPDPEKMISDLHEQGIRLILWQIPVWKRMDNGEAHEILDADWKYAVEHDLCIKNNDGTPYFIPENHWFAGSMLPDFTNPETIQWWFGKRQYLLDMGVDGFKTDGGEFVLKDDVISYNGLTGKELCNYYVSSYVKAYTEFIGKDRILFSRAGYIGQQQYPLQWAGDQQSTWEEFRHIVTAGLSAGMSGIPFWGFDIGGFAGPMPELELYERSVQMATFAPVMQWHSEPVGGQFADEYPTVDRNNDRSPWNISRFYGNEEFCCRLRFWFRLRMNLLPYLYQQSLISVRTGLPMMRHLGIEYPNDAKAFEVDDCFMLGDLLIAPILEKGKEGRNVYLPNGNWIDLWSMGKITGGKNYEIVCGSDRIPVFIRECGCIALNLDETLTLGSDVGNGIEQYKNLCFYISGNAGKYEFQDDCGNHFVLKWDSQKYSIEVLSGKAVCNILRELNI